MAKLSGVLTLNDDVLLTPVAELEEASRDQFSCDPEDVAVSRLEARGGSKIIGADAAELVRLFREPRQIVEAVILYARQRQLEPDAVLEDAYPLLRSLVDSGVLVPAGESGDAGDAGNAGDAGDAGGTDGAAAGGGAGGRGGGSRTGGKASASRTRWRAGDRVLNATVTRVGPVLDDTEIYFLQRPDGTRSVLKAERASAASPLGGPLRARLTSEAAILARLAEGDGLSSRDGRAAATDRASVARGIDAAAAQAHRAERAHQEMDSQFEPRRAATDRAAAACDRSIVARDRAVLTDERPREGAASIVVGEARVADSKAVDPIAPALLGQGVADGRAYIELEWLAGTDAATAAAEWREREDRPALLSLIQRIARAYVALHARGVLHGDVHPRNVLVLPDGTPRLIDFGFAHDVAAEIASEVLSDGSLALACRVAADVADDADDVAHSGALARLPPPAPSESGRGGVPFFYEPELARAYLAGARPPAPTPAGEQHAVAALCYFLAAGAYWQDFRLDREGLLHDIVDRQPIALAARGVAEWPELDAVLGRALAKQPEDRFADMAAFAAAVDAIAITDAREPHERDQRHESREPHHRREPSTALAPRESRSAIVAARQPLLTSLVDRALAGADLDGPWLRDGLSPAPTCSINYGAAGVALGLLHIAQRRRDAHVLALADVWLRRAEQRMQDADAFHNTAIEITRDTVGDASPFHAPSGLHTVSALLARAVGNPGAQADAIARFASEAARPARGLDLTLGRSSTLLASAILLDALPQPARSRTASSPNARSLSSVPPDPRSQTAHAAVANSAHSPAATGAPHRPLAPSPAQTRDAGAALRRKSGGTQFAQSPQFEAGGDIGAGIRGDASAQRPASALPQNVEIAGIDPQPLLAHGAAAIAEIWAALDSKPAIPQADIDYPGIAHGWAGFLYATLLWCRVSGQPCPDGVERRLSELAALALPEGRGLEWPWVLPRAGGAMATMPGWCNGSCGYVFLWTLAHRMVGAPAYLDLATGAAWNSWESAEGGETLCCGLPGRAYALLDLYRHTRDAIWLSRARDLAWRGAKQDAARAEYPHSLYKGGFGLAVLAADLDAPDEAIMPCFQPMGYGTIAACPS
jgi:serine/threonine protein kinase